MTITHTFLSPNSPQVAPSGPRPPPLPPSLPPPPPVSWPGSFPAILIFVLGERRGAHDVRGLEGGREGGREGRGGREEAVRKIVRFISFSWCRQGGGREGGREKRRGGGREGGREGQRTFYLFLSSLQIVFGSGLLLLQRTKVLLACGLGEGGREGGREGQEWNGQFSLTTEWYRREEGGREAGREGGRGGGREGIPAAVVALDFP